MGKGKEEFTLDEFKKIVPSRNVLKSFAQNSDINTFFSRNFLWSGHFEYSTKTAAEPFLSQSLLKQCINFLAKEKTRKFHFFLKFMT